MSYLPNICINIVSVFQIISLSQVISVINIISAEKSLNEEEFKTTGYNNINVDVIKNIFDEIKTSLINTFNLSFNTGTLEITRASPIVKKSKKSLLTNYWPISVCPCFSKIIKRIMCNRLYTYLTENKIFFNSLVSGLVILPTTYF